MVSAVLTERRHSGGFLVSESPGRFSRAQVTLLQQGAILAAGTLLGQVTVGLTAAIAAQTVPGANAGNGTSSAIALSQGVLQGAYQVTFVSAVEFEVYTPAGDLLGEGRNGVAFALGGLGFTITAGGTAFVAGDGFVITVAANANVGLYNALSLAAADGTQIPAAILFNESDATSGNKKVAVINRDAEVNGSELIYPAGATANQIAAINAAIQTSSGMNVVIR